MSREQEHAAERLSLQNGGRSLAIRDGFLDQHIEVTVHGGRSWIACRRTV